MVNLGLYFQTLDLTKTQVLLNLGLESFLIRAYTFLCKISEIGSKILFFVNNFSNRTSKLLRLFFIGDITNYL